MCSPMNVRQLERLAGELVGNLQLAMRRLSGRDLQSLYGARLGGSILALEHFAESAGRPRPPSGIEEPLTLR
jgi:hypothetical protein